MTLDTAPHDGIVQIPSQHAVAVTLDRLESLLKEHGIKVFARIDFSGDAAQVGLSMPPQQALIFGNPKAGTPLLIGAPTVALDLPLKAVAWEDRDGKVWVAYNAPEYVVQRHGLSPHLAANLAAALPLVQAAAQ